MLSGGVFVKRFFSLVVVFSLVLSAAVIPASAAEANYGVFNLLEYGSIVYAASDNYSGDIDRHWYASNYMLITSNGGGGSFEVGWNNPGYSSIIGFTALVIMNGFTELTHDSGDLVISDTNYGSNVKMLSVTYSSPVSSLQNIQSFYFDYTCASNQYSVSIEFLSFYIKTAYNTTVRTSVQIYDTIHSTTETFLASDSSYSYSVNMNYNPTNQAGIPSGLCTIRLRPLAQEGTFDFWDLNFEVTGINITSISCLQGDKILDFDVGYTYMDADGSIIVNPDSQGAGDILTNTYTRVWVSLRVYTKAANFIEGWPLVFINGTSTSAITDGLQWNITFYPSYISYNPSVLDPYIFWLSKIYSALNPSGGNEAAEKFNDKVQEQSEQLNQMAGVMDSVNKPDIDSVQSDISSIVPQGDITLATAPLGTLLSNEIIVTIFSISLLFVMVSYILFGKKG